jgi:hypothetical protein
MDVTGAVSSMVQPPTAAAAVAAAPAAVGAGAGAEPEPEPLGPSLILLPDPENALYQGLPLIHHLARSEHFLWDTSAEGAQVPIKGGGRSRL